MTKKITLQELRRRAKDIKVVGMDVDGLLTAGEIIILNSGEELKIWSVRDRVGFFLVRDSGADIRLVWITARRSQQVHNRAKDLHIHKLYQKCKEKRLALESLMADFQVKPAQVLFIGDDLIDLPVLRRVGLAVAPADAPVEVRDVVHHVTKAAGGRGVFREVIEVVLKAQGRWKQATAAYYM